MSLRQALIVGPTAAFCSELMTYPQDVIKTHIQVNPSGTYPRAKWLNDGGIISCAKSIFNEKGFRGFSIGLGPYLGRALLSDGVCLAVY